MNVPHVGERQLWVADGLDKIDVDYSLPAVPARSAERANLIASATDEHNVHLPILDVDHSCRLVESSPGKFHLFIDVPMTWDAYCRLLDVMTEVGVLEANWVEACKRDGATMVRLRPEEKRRKT